MNIYEIADELQQLQQMLVDNPEDEYIPDTLESVQYDLELKAEGYVKIIKNLEAQALAYKNEIDRMSAKKHTIENSIDRLKQALFNAMSVTGTDKIKGELFNISLRNNAPQLPKDLDIHKVPVMYLVEQEPKIDRKELLKAVKNGEVTFIDLVQSKSLSIR